MDIDLIGGSYEQRIKNINPQRTINWYPVNKTEIEKNKTLHSLFPTPGLTEFTSATGNKVRGMVVTRDLTSVRCFAVIDSTLYEIYKDTTITSRGVLPDTSGGTHPVYFTVNSNNQLGIFDSGSTAAYMDTFTFVTNNGTLTGNVFDMSTNTLSAISDVDFPNTSADIGRAYFSNADDITAWTAADVFTPTIRADPIQRIIIFRDELYCFGTETIEIYINNQETGFERRGGTVIQGGILSPHTAAVYHGGIFFVGQNKDGEPAVYTITREYEMLQVSPHSVNWQLGNAQSLRDATGYIQYTKDGHIFYYVSVPSLGTTYVFDQINNEWHERRSSKPYVNVDGTRDQGQFRGFCHVNFDGLILFGDLYSGKIFKEDYDVFTEDSLPIIRERTSIVYTKEYKSLSVFKLELDINTGNGTATGQGSDPILMVYVSKDGGHTFPREKTVGLGVLGDRRKRVRLNALGSAEHWCFKFRLTDPISCAIIGATISGSYGAS